MLCWKKLLLHVICPKPRMVLGAYNLISRTQRNWDGCAQVLSTAQVGYHGTSWSLHSAAGFSLETRIILSNKITLVNNHRGNSVNCWRNNKKGGKNVHNYLIKTFFVLVKAPKSAHIYVKAGGGEPDMERGRLLQEPGDTAGFQWLPWDHCHCFSAGHVAGHKTIKIYWFEYMLYAKTKRVT